MDFSQFYKLAKKRRGVEYGANIHLSPDGKACVYLTMPKDEDTRGCYYWLIPLKAKDTPDHKGNEILQRLKTKSKTFNLKFLISLTLICHNPFPCWDPIEMDSEEGSPQLPCNYPE